MAGHKVAANLLMAIIIAAGLLSAVALPQETFPGIEMDLVRVTVAYPGASPEEVEAGVVRPVEEVISGISGVDRVRGTAAENVGTVLAELDFGADRDEALDNIKAAVDRIATFPADTEEPLVATVEGSSMVMTIAIYGDASETTLKELASRVKDDLVARPGISLVEVSGVRRYEVSIEISQETLRAHGLTLDEIAAAVRRGSVDLPGGTVATEIDNIRVQVRGENYTRNDFAEIIVRADLDGSMLRLADIADIRDGFESTDLINSYNGQPAAFVRVQRTGDEQVGAIAADVRSYLEDELSLLVPRGVSYDIWQSEATYFEDRVSLLLRNGALGLALVLLALGLFLDPRLAFWTGVGLFLSFAGVFAVLSALGESINMMSLFGFILAVGIVVDDAIVVGENIYREREMGAPPLQAAIDGTIRVSTPVIFAVLTTVAAFSPLLFVPGTLGKFLYVIPVVVIAVLMLSLVEGLFILPRHLSHLPDPNTAPAEFRSVAARMREAVRRGTRELIEGPLDRVVRYSVRRPGMVLLGTVAVMLLTVGVITGNHVRRSLMPSIQAEFVVAYVELADGTPSERTIDVARRLERTGLETVDSLETAAGVSDPQVRAALVSVGERPSQGGPDLSFEVTTIRPNIAEVILRLVPPRDQAVAPGEIAEAWRNRIGPVAGVEEMTFSAELIDFGDPVVVELTHSDFESLDMAVSRLQGILERIPGVEDVRNDQRAGTRELELELKPAARTLGLALEDLARQVRGAFYGNEVRRVQRGREEVRIFVRLPEEDRDAITDLQNFRIRTPGGGEAPLSEVADIVLATGPTTISRIDGRRIATVTADVNEAVTTPGIVNGELGTDILPALGASFPGLRYEFGGEQREQADAFAGLGRGFLLALLAIFALLAIPFRSYTQPLVTMAAIPMGLVGATLAHLLLDMELGMLSMFGIVGLAGVAVNGSLVMIDFINQERRAGLPMPEAIVSGAKARFRPIMLTSLTTFLGVFPIILEQDTQAQFLKPMAASLGFGVLFVAAVIMVVVPALAMVDYEMTKRLSGMLRLRRRTRAHRRPAPA